MTSPVGLARPMLAGPLPSPLAPPERPAPPPASPLPDLPPGMAPPITPNPSLRIEPTIGVVVFEVRDGAGQVTRSVPTERELNAYRTAALRGEDAPDPAPRAAGGPGPADQTLSPPGGSPSSASPLAVPAEGAPKAPDPSPARLIK